LGTPLLHPVHECASIDDDWRERRSQGDTEGLDEYFQRKARCLELLCETLTPEEQKIMVNLPDKGFYNVSPLMLATLYNNLPVAKMLIHYGAEDSEGMKDLNIAAMADEHGFPSIEAYLRSFLASPPKRKHSPTVSGVVLNFPSKRE
jgi:hypothetical protein